MDFERILKFYDYKVPQELIAQEPASPRDFARLLVYDRKKDKVFYDTFTNLAKYLPNGAVLVFNETKVIPARFVVKKETGGRVKVLYIASNGNLIKVMADRKISIGAKLIMDKKIFFIAKKQERKYYYLKPSFYGERSRTIPIKNLYKILEKYGEAPLPPYIKHSPLGRVELKEKYQAVFARHKGSVAAPTASLHFTSRLMRKIKKAGFDIRFVTLHVNLGTFAPLEERHLKEGKLHEEYYEIDKKTAAFLNKAKKSGRPIIAVGTTVARTLESAARLRSPQEAGAKGVLKNLSGKTGLFIRERYRFKFTDAIITNFHVPRSSLLMLVAAFTSRKKLLDLYKKAMRKKFKFFSFGDGMLIR